MLGSNGYIHLCVSETEPERHYWVLSLCKNLLPFHACLDVGPEDGRVCPDCRQRLKEESYEKWFAFWGEVKEETLASETQQETQVV